MFPYSRPFYGVPPAYPELWGVQYSPPAFHGGVDRAGNRFPAPPVPQYAPPDFDPRTVINDDDLRPAPTHEPLNPDLWNDPFPDAPAGGPADREMSDHAFHQHLLQHGLPDSGPVWAEAQRRQGAAPPATPASRYAGEGGFERAIRDTPWDVTNHRVYADWLREQRGEQHPDALFRDAVADSVQRRLEHPTPTWDEGRWLDQSPLFGDDPYQLHTWTTRTGPDANTHPYRGRTLAPQLFTPPRGTPRPVWFPRGPGRAMTPDEIEAHTAQNGGDFEWWDTWEHGGRPLHAEERLLAGIDPVEGMRTGLWPMVERLMRGRFDRGQRFSDDDTPTEYAPTDPVPTPGWVTLPDQGIFTPAEAARRQHGQYAAIPYGDEGDDYDEPMDYRGVETDPQNYDLPPRLLTGEPALPRLNPKWKRPKRGYANPHAPRMGYSAIPQIYADPGTDEYYRHHPLDLTALDAASDWHGEQGHEDEAAFHQLARKWLGDRLDRPPTPPAREPEYGALLQPTDPFRLRTLDLDPGAGLTPQGWFLGPKDFGWRQGQPPRWKWGHDLTAGSSFVADPAELHAFLGTSGPDDPRFARRHDAAVGHLDRYFDALTPAERVRAGIDPLHAIDPDTYVALMRLLRERHAELGHFADPAAPTEYGAVPYEDEEERSFLEQIMAHPEDATNALVFADWLQDRGRDTLAQHIRRYVEQAGRGARVTGRGPHTWGDEWRLHGGHLGGGEWMVEPSWHEPATAPDPDDPNDFLEGVRGLEWPARYPSASAGYPVGDELRRAGLVPHGGGYWQEGYDSPFGAAGGPDRVFDQAAAGATERLSRYEHPSDHAHLSPEKARTILRDGTVRGRPLTDKQRGFFGAVAGRRTDNCLYGDAEDEAAFLHSVHADPYDTTAHGAFADWLDDRGRSDDAAFRRAVAPWITERLGSGPPEWDPEGWLSQPGREGDDRHQLATSERVGSGPAGDYFSSRLYEPHVPGGRRPLPWWAPRFTYPTHVAEHPPYDKVIGSRPGNMWTSMLLNPAERALTGIDQLANVDPRLWPQIEALLRGRHDRGVRLEDGDSPVAYADTAWSTAGGTLEEPDMDEFLHQRPHGPNNLHPAAHYAADDDMDYAGSVGYGRPKIVPAGFGDYPEFLQQVLSLARFGMKGTEIAGYLNVPPNRIHELLGGFPKLSRPGRSNHPERETTSPGDPRLADIHARREAGETLAAIAADHGITGERVRQLAGLPNLPVPSESSKLSRYDDMDYAGGMDGAVPGLRYPPHDRPPVPYLPHADASNMDPLGIEFSPDPSTTFPADTPRGVIADFLEERGHPDHALLRTGAPLDLHQGQFRTPEMTLGELFQAGNHGIYEDEPWTAGDGLPLIDIDGADALVLASDGVARWVNNDLRWHEVEPHHVDRLVEWMGDRDPSKAARLRMWMRHFWEEGGPTSYADADDFHAQIRQEPRDTDTHRVFADWLQDRHGEGHPDEAFRRDLADLIDLRGRTPFPEPDERVAGWQRFLAEPPRGMSGVPSRAVGHRNSMDMTHHRIEMLPIHQWGGPPEGRWEWSPDYHWDNPSDEPHADIPDLNEWLLERQRAGAGGMGYLTTPAERAAFDLVPHEHLANPGIRGAWPRVEQILREWWDRHGQRFEDDEAPLEYATDYGEEDDILAGVHRDPYDTVGHLALADWYAEQGRPEDEAFRRAVAPWITERLAAPPAEFDPSPIGAEGGRMLQPGRAGDDRYQIRTTRLVGRGPRGRYFTNLTHEPFHDVGWGPGGLAVWGRTFPGGAVPGAAGDYPDDAAFWGARRTPEQGPYAITPAERALTGIDQLANVDPRLWPQVEALLRGRHDWGVRLSRTGE